MKKGHSSKRILMWSVAIICAAIFVFSGYKLYSIYQGYSEAQDYYKTVQENSPFKNNKKKLKNRIKLDINSEKLKKINSDFCGWLYVKNTMIDYPVVKAKDNDYYLHRDFHLNYLYNGCLFFDYRCKSDMSDFRTVIYGHHMKDGSMFGQLKKFRDKGFFDRHRHIYYVNADGELLVLKVYSVHTTSDDSFVYRLDRTSMKSREKFIEKSCEKAIFKTDVVPTTEDHIVTLSTCAYEYEGARYVVHAIVEP